MVAASVHVDSGTTEYWRTLRGLMLLVLVNQLVVAPVASSIVGGGAAIVVNSMRLLIITIAGWLLVRKGLAGVWAASWAGPLLLFVDHVVLKGGLMVLAGLVGTEEGWLGFAGVLASYVMYAPVTLLPAWIGAAIARRQQGAPAAVGAGSRPTTRTPKAKWLRAAYRALVVLAVVGPLIQVYAGPPDGMPPVPAPSEMSVSGVWEALDILAGLGAMVAAGLGYAGLFLFWRPARIIVAAQMAWALGSFARGSMVEMMPAILIAIVLDVVLLVLAFASPLAAEFGYEVRFSRVVLVTWLSFTACLVLGLLVFALGGVPAGWTAVLGSPR